MAGGGGSQQSYQTQQSSTGPPSQIAPYLQQGVNDLAGLYAYNKAPEYYPGQTVADFSPQTQQALQMQEQRATAGSPVTQGANALAANTLGGQYLSLDSNPYFKDALAASLQPGTDQFMNQVIPGITSQFAGSGRSGGSGLQQDVTNQAVTSYGRAQADASVKAASDMYNQERANQMGVLGMSPQLANQDYADIQQLGLAGSAYDTREQQLIDADVQKYNYNANKDVDYINRYLASLNAGYPGGTSTGMSTGLTPGPQSNTFGSIFGGLTGLAGAGLMAFGGSDERFKENIKRVGETDDGQPLYFFNYKGDGTPQVGLMAQDVEKRDPDAVVEDERGYKWVNYHKALGLF